MDHAHDFETAHGGFWIMADGSSAPVASEYGHTTTLGKLRLGNTYGDAYKLGMVRISFCGSSDRMYVTFDKHAAVLALRTLVQIVRHLEATRTSVLVEGYKGDYNENCDVHNFDGETRVGASKVMQLVLAKNAAERAALQGTLMQAMVAGAGA